MQAGGDNSHHFLMKKINKIARKKGGGILLYCAPNHKYMHCQVEIKGDEKLLINLEGRWCILQLLHSDTMVGHIIKSRLGKSVELHRRTFP